MTWSLDWLLLIPCVMGVVGNLLDSVFGAVLENPGHISKYTNNCSTAIIGGLLGLLILALVRARMEIIIYLTSIPCFGMTAIAAGQHPVPSRTRK